MSRVPTERRREYARNYVRQRRAEQRAWRRQNDAAKEASCSHGPDGFCRACRADHAARQREAFAKQREQERERWALKAQQREQRAWLRAFEREADRERFIARHWMQMRGWIRSTQDVPELLYDAALIIYRINQFLKGRDE